MSQNVIGVDTGEFNRELRAIETAADEINPQDYNESFEATKFEQIMDMNRALRMLVHNYLLILKNDYEQMKKYGVQLIEKDESFSEFTGNILQRRRSSQ